MLTALNFAGLWPFISRNIQWIALAVAVVVILGGAYRWGVSNERAKWEAEAAAQQAALQKAMTETRAEKALLEAEVNSIIAGRDALLEELRDEALAQVGADTVCFDPRSMRDLATSLERIHAGGAAE